MNILNKMRIFMATGSGLLLLMLLLASYMQTDHEKEIMDNLFFESVFDGQRIQLGLWQDEAEEIYYLFLPSCFNENAEEFILKYEDGKGLLKIDGTSYRDGDIIKDLEEEKLYKLELQGPFGSFYMSKGFRVLASETVPAIMITVEDEEDLLKTEEFSNKKYIETGDMLMLDEKGDILCSEKLAKFKVRGNLTAALDKKPFTFSFYEPVSLCGMAPAVKWNLLANATDGSYIRNKLILDLANESTNAYEPDGKFAELYLNGKYQGLYLLTEAVEVEENRLEISAEKDCFLEMELDFRLEEDMSYVITDRGQLFVIHKERTVTDEEKEGIKNWLNDIESTLFAENDIPSQDGKPLCELLDMESWAEAWLIQEISGDHDTGIASQFAYALDKADPLLYAGPVWDFDGTMGNVNTVMFTNPEALTTSITNSRPQGNPNQNRWLAAMYRNDTFRAVLEEKYANVFKKNLEEVLDQKIDDYMKEISRSAVLDAFRWHEKRLEWMFVLPENLEIPDMGDYSRYAQLESHTDMIKRFLKEKKDFLDKLWIEHRNFCVVEVKNESSILNQDYNQTIYFWVEKGTPIENLSQYEKINGQTFYYRNVDTGKIITDADVIWENCTLEGIWQQEGES